MAPGILAFIGGGNMAASLIGGLIARGMPAGRIIVADRVPEQLQALRTRFGIRTTSSNPAAAAEADTVLFAVKPQDLASVSAELRDVLARRRPLLISIAAGVHSRDLQRWVGGLPVVRCMPNRPAMQGCGVTGMYATHEVAATQRELAEQVLGAVGTVLWLEREEDLDAVTAISGSGPAYFFLLIESLQQAGQSLGLPEEISRKLAIETAYGASMMARVARESAATLREQVTSKGGTTEAALKHLEASDFRGIMATAVAAAARRSAQLAEELAG
ncbi:pyrroline-5-carboxylate reductase [Steroidobacter denitrificans]|uniref:Pyrroline-5-carboxylate reductase n=2 Tax=Steroidobacter denitrificans TaxID=465721 RepID=A0A127F821_STEDE|nr:pyrroline-5-carboxylate reductase [Steroidobacter denitrificans]